jgi:hypothetical protein
MLRVVCPAASVWQTAVNSAKAARPQGYAGEFGMAAESASGIPLDLIGLVTPLPADGGPVPGEIVEH